MSKDNSKPNKLNKCFDLPMWSNRKYHKDVYMVLLGDLEPDKKLDAIDAIFDDTACVDPAQVIWQVFEMAQAGVTKEDFGG